MDFGYQLKFQQNWFHACFMPTLPENAKKNKSVEGPSLTNSNSGMFIYWYPKSILHPLLVRCALDCESFEMEICSNKVFQMIRAGNFSEVDVNLTRKSYRERGEKREVLLLTILLFICT